MEIWKKMWVGVFYEHSVFIHTQFAIYALPKFHSRKEASSERYHAIIYQLFIGTYSHHHKQMNYE